MADTRCTDTGPHEGHAVPRPGLPPGWCPGVPAAPAEPATGHASPHCGCGFNDAGQYYQDPICVRRDFPLGHEFQPVAGHPDDDECTYRTNGTEDSYCGRREAEHNAAPDDADMTEAAFDAAHAAGEPVMVVGCACRRWAWCARPRLCRVRRDSMADRYTADVRKLGRWLYEIHGTGHLDSTWITLEGPTWYRPGRRWAMRSAERHVRRMNRRAARDRAADASKITISEERHG